MSQVAITSVEYSQGSLSVTINPSFNSLSGSASGAITVTDIEEQVNYRKEWSADILGGVGEIQSSFDIYIPPNIEKEEFGITARVTQPTESSDIKSITVRNPDYEPGSGDDYTELCTTVSIQKEGPGNGDGGGGGDDGEGNGGRPNKILDRNKIIVGVGAVAAGFAISRYSNRR
jgi:hypothetical protein